MKSLTSWSLGIALSIWPVVIGCSQHSSPLSDSSASLITTSSLLESQAAAAETLDTAPADSVAVVSTNSPSTNASVDVAQSDISSDAVTVTNLTDAPTKPLAIEKSTPPNVRATGPVADLARLASSGVDESVLQAYITNSTSIFNANADEIIYLNDLGVSSSVVNTMLMHDQGLKEAMAASMATAPPPPTPAPPQPEQYAPQPDTSVPMVAEPPATAPPVSDVSDATFYDALSPYGNWVDVEGYGPCWQPSVVVVNPGWQPYFDGGHWVYTDCGWYWQSGYSWGWAPFHYGRWFQHNHLGWCWAPDTVWAASWVSWRYTEGYCGWAPLPPGAWYHHDTGLTYCGNRVGLGFGFGLGANSFHFVPWGHFSDHHLPVYAVKAPEHVNRVFAQSTAVTRISSNGRVAANNGLSVDRVVAASHLAVHQVALRPTRVALAQDTGARTPRASHTSTRSVTVLQPPISVTSMERPRRATTSSPTGASGGANERSSPRSSLVVIGRNDGARPQASSGWNPYTHPYGNPIEANSERSTRGRVTANAETTTPDNLTPDVGSVERRPTRALPGGGGYGNRRVPYQAGGSYPSAPSAPSASSAPPTWSAPNYQATPWMNRSQSTMRQELPQTTRQYSTPAYVAPEVPRYTPAPVQQPRYQAEPSRSAPAPRSYSAPAAPSVPAPAPAARSAPSAPAQNNNNTRNGR